MKPFLSVSATQPGGQLLWRLADEILLGATVMRQGHSRLYLMPWESLVLCVTNTSARTVIFILLCILHHLCVSTPGAWR